ncbi:hypothetical protein HYH02_009171 [Chlamydomonas schloesseri]|uniref:Uncharacterized protein n=1 Tax=Chlamydomonas schloesseri TaxID=2026947 RepID=A0A835WAW8_9CHLO|nr:hypothetical protein HYH02_009171 [Chlamydomonas schloesseri]|eukprot:KAG2443970.1 hypothetical protein HYH02_009171 [Chlamydomonas schloesseri]
MAGRKQQRTSSWRKAPKAGGGNTSQSQRVHIHINNAAAPRRPANTRTMQRELLLGPMGLRGLPYMAAPSTTIINQMPSDAYNARFATDALLQGLQSEVRALKSENMGLHDHIDQAWGQVAAAFKPPSYPSDSDFTSTAYGAGGSSSSGGSSGGGPPAPRRAASPVMMPPAPTLALPPAPPPAVFMPPSLVVQGPEASMDGSSGSSSGPSIKLEPNRHRTAITIDDSTSAISSRGSNNMTQAVRRRAAAATAAAVQQSTQGTVGSMIAPLPTIKPEPTARAPPRAKTPTAPSTSTDDSGGSDPSVNSPGVKQAVAVHSSGASTSRALAEYSRRFSELTKELDQPATSASAKDARRRLRELAFAVGSEVNDKAQMDLTKSKAHRSYYNKVRAMAAPMASSGYPSNLRYLVKRLVGYSRNTFRLQTLNQTSATAGQIVTVDLPSNSLCDLNTLTMFFKGTTSTTARFAVLPRNIETILERVEIEANGQIIQVGSSMYNQLWQIIADTSMGEDVTNRRRILQGAGDIATAPTANQTNVQFAIQNWLGFLGSVKPSVLDTSLIGNVRLRLTLAQPVILAKSPTCAGESYALSDIFFTVDTLSIDDGVFYQMHQQFLSSGGVYELPFHSYMAFTSTGGMSQTTKFSLSTQSLNRCWATFLTGGNFPLAAAPTTGAFVDPNSLTSPYFTRLGSAGTIAYGATTNNTPITYTLSNYQFSINGVPFPNFRPDTNQAYALMLNGYGLSQDTLGGGHKNLDSLTKWNNAFWVACASFEHGSDDYISGLDTRGNVAQGFWETQGTISQGANVGTGGSNPGTSLTAVVFCETTSVLRVGDGRQLELVM